MDTARNYSIEQLQSLLRDKNSEELDVGALPPLFADEEDYRQWLAGRHIRQLPYVPFKPGDNPLCFLGIDSGSTTTKILILKANGEIAYTYYSANHGNSLQTTYNGLKDFLNRCASDGFIPQIASSCSTGYGEDLMKQAFDLDHGIVETMAHLQGAQWLNPAVSFVLDIGGQDMKSLFVENGVITNIELNEACSSGCGSFLQNFAAAMNMTLEEFSLAACMAKQPADLGTRCTVFMNSRVKQSLRQNASVGNIAAGLAYSVVKNCLFKVLKISNLNTLGDNIVVQGGTFRNHAVYRALEILSGKQVSSTSMPEMMGALGAALHVKLNAGTHLTKSEQLTLTNLNSHPLVDKQTDLNEI
jgi:predicted CoA-substrate-specific enzyme activase